MKREFLEGLGLEVETVDKILAENESDVKGEKAKTDQAKADLAEVRTQLEARTKDLEALQASAGDSEAIKQQLADLQERYNSESEQHKNELAERDYMDAVNSAVADLKFSSKGARAAFVAGLKEKKLEVKDGKLVGFEQHLKEAKESDPEAFQPDKPKPRFSGTVGGGGEGAKPKTAGEQLAASIGKNDAARSKAANDIVNMYIGGNK